MDQKNQTKQGIFCMLCLMAGIFGACIGYSIELKNIELQETNQVLIDSTVNMERKVDSLKSITDSINGFYISNIDEAKAYLK